MNESHLDSILEIQSKCFESYILFFLSLRVLSEKAKMEDLDYEHTIAKIGKHI